MGFRFRRRIGLLPGLHLNIGGSGFSVSLGGRGATLNLKPGRRPRVTVGIPGTGMSYSTTIGSGEAAERPAARKHRSPMPAASLPALAEALAEIRQGRHDQAETRADLEDEKRRAEGRLRRLSFPLWGWLAGEAVRRAQAEIDGLADRLAEVGAASVGGLSIRWNTDRTTIATYRAVLDAFGHMARAAAVWEIGQGGGDGQSSAPTFAQRRISRHPATIGWGRPAVLPARPEDPFAEVPCLETAGGGLYLFPWFVLVAEGEDVAAIDPAALRVTCAPLRFREDGDVPADAQPVDETWRHVDRDGQPDPRYRDNPRVPVMLYAELSLAPPAGCGARYLVSDAEAAGGFARAMLDWARRAAPPAV